MTTSDGTWYDEDAGPLVRLHVHEGRDGAGLLGRGDGLLSGAAVGLGVGPDHVGSVEEGKWAP